MAYQLEVVRFRDVLPVLYIPGFVQGLSPLTVELKGADFSSAVKVSINDTEAPEFMIVDKKTIYAQLPEGIGPISSIEVLSSRFSREVETAKLEFEVGNKTQKVDGILKLVQLFTKWILQSPGSDLFNPSRGGGLQQIVGKVSTSRDMQTVLAAITRAVSTTVSQIRAAQIAAVTLPLSERLLSATLVDLKVYEAHMQARARVFIQSAGGTEAVSALVL